MAETLVISTHLDDAVLSIGKLLSARPGAVVLTVFAGRPPRFTTTKYDLASGFIESRSAVHHRREEDRTALDLLDARPLHADLLDHQYSMPSTDDEVAEVVCRAVDEIRPETVFGPVGLFHPDHEQVGRVWPAAVAGAGVRHLIAYEDLPYRNHRPRRAAAAVERFAARHRANAEPGHADPLEDARHEGRKAIAMLAYASQLRFVAPLSCLAEERLWRLTADQAASPAEVR
ncbi:PIG-L family deacetylase [Micromonospora sp. FIMYZ51]|uniref:PIG-L deacetylase family protein n=1 Tax=Micromonospora sp. FIMYZ51 TaxID=3051832 RepID=UPI00311DFC86